MREDVVNSAVKSSENGVQRAARQPHRGKAILFVQSGSSAGDPNAFGVRSRDISTSGVFLEADVPVQVGDDVDMVVGGRDNRVLRVAARVVRVCTDGFGAEFLADSREAQAIVNDFVASLAATSS